MPNKPMTQSESQSPSIEITTVLFDDALNMISTLSGLTKADVFKALTMQGSKKHQTALPLKTVKVHSITSVLEQNELQFITQLFH